MACLGYSILVSVEEQKLSCFLQTAKAQLSEPWARETLIHNPTSRPERKSSDSWTSCCFQSVGPVGVLDANWMRAFANTAGFYNSPVFAWESRFTSDYLRHAAQS